LPERGCSGAPQRPDSRSPLGSEPALFNCQILVPAHRQLRAARNALLSLILHKACARFFISASGFFRTHHVIGVAWESDMPKRDENYMEGQRRAIVMAALDVLLEKGIYDTTLRDICQRGGFSVGAFYTHFKTMDDVVVAACTVDFENATKDETDVDTWDEYLEDYRDDILNTRNPRTRKRFRLSLQLIAGQIMAKENLPGLSRLYNFAENQYRKKLNHLRDRGEISLPLGLDQTAYLHMIAYLGTGYFVHANKDIELKDAAENLLRALSALVVVNDRAIASAPSAGSAPVR
jgi:AcrR family transcriptional regulator